MSSRGLEGIISLFGFQGLAGTPVAKSSSDTGSGTDSEAVAQAITGTDLGSGVEETPTVVPAVPGTDEGTGAETIALAVTLSGSETGSGVDAVSTAVREAEPSDTGEGVETSTLSVTLSSSDTGSGADTSALAVDRMILVTITAIEPYREIEYTLP